MGRATVIYDSDCGFCKWCLALLLSIARDEGGDEGLRPLPLGTPESDRLLADLSVEERDASWHLVLDGAAPSGGVASAGVASTGVASDAVASAGVASNGAPRLSAGAALAPAMAFVRGGRLPAAVFRRFPGASERGYRWVAEHRGLLGRFVPERARRWADRVIAAHGSAQ